jgi:hypothetical protein
MMPLAAKGGIRPYFLSAVRAFSVTYSDFIHPHPPLTRQTRRRPTSRSYYAAPDRRPPYRQLSGPEFGIE